ncbi:MAG TPA: pyridoxal-phosphate dependent enzyme [Terriglobales bacterium]
MPITPFTIRDARTLLSRYLPQTRLVHAPSLSSLKASVYLKLESELPTGSFKPRGAIYALATRMSRRSVKEVIASSTGNHGAAVAYAAKQLGVPATIFLPDNPNPVKRKRIADLGAKIVEQGSGDLAEACRKARAYSENDETIYFLNDATDLDLPAGPATIGAEILEQRPGVSAIYVPMGDTALIRGVAAASKQRPQKVKIIGVQAQRAPSYFLSWQQGNAVETETCDTIADGLATRTPEAENVKAIRELVDDVCLVTEEQMLEAIRHLALEEHLVAEPAGAAATAALLSRQVEVQGDVVALVSGANIAPDVLRRALCEGRR